MDWIHTFLDNRIKMLLMLVSIVHNNIRLKSYAEYTYGRCLLECKLDLIASRSDMRCVPWYLPPLLGMPLCDPWKALIFKELLGLIKIYQFLV